MGAAYWGVATFAAIPELLGFGTFRLDPIFRKHVFDVRGAQSEAVMNPDRNKMISVDNESPFRCRKFGARS